MQKTLAIEIERVEMFTTKPTLEEAQTVLANAITATYTSHDKDLKRHLYDSLCQVFYPLESRFGCWCGNSHQSAQVLAGLDVKLNDLVERAQERLRSTWIN